MRFYTIVVSIVAHVAALLVLVVVPIVAMDALPMARQVTAFVRATAAELPDVPPPPRGGTPRADRTDTPVVVPTRAPDRIEAERAGPNPEGYVPYQGPPGVADGVDGALPLVNVPQPVAPPPLPREPVRPGGDIQPPRKIRHVTPVYPHLARTAGKQGTVILEAVIAEDGQVRDVRVLRSIQFLDRAAMDAVRQWQFTPTLLNGQPVPVVMTVTVTFELK